MRYYEIIAESKTLKELEIADLVDQADHALPLEAERAITAFVGMSAGAAKGGVESGIMQQHRLEDAYSDNPSPRGMQIRKEIDAAFKPIKQKLKQLYGSTIRLYRHQEDLKDDKNTRNVLSWTSRDKVAQFFAGINYEVKPITDDSIKKAVNDYNKTGKAQFGKYEFERDEDYPDSYIISYDGEELTDGDDLEEFLRDKQKERNEQIAKQEKMKERIIQKDVNIDDIIWITDRANQAEFIIKNHPTSSGHISNKNK
jgi:hypothetical protein